jgi:hypothetical protein
MNDISFSEDDFCMVLLVLGSMGILVSGLLFFTQDIQVRRNRRMQILSKRRLRPQPETWVSGDPEKGAAPGASLQETRKCTIDE